MQQANSQRWFVTLNSLIYGKQTEETALKCLEFKINIKIQKCGLFNDKFIPYLATTPGI